MLIVERVTEGPGEDALYRELFAGLSTPMPALDRTPWPPPAGIVAGREGDGSLVGWAVCFAWAGEEGAAAFQWIVTERERQRITAGHNTTHDASLEEVTAVAALAAAAADLAREAGYSCLRWLPAEPGIAEGVAEALRARPVDDAEGFRSWRLSLGDRAPGDGRVG